MQKMKKTKKCVKPVSPEERFNEAKVRIVMKVRCVSRERALAILSAGDSSSVDKATPPVTPAALPDDVEEDDADEVLMSAEEFFGSLK